MTFGEKLRMLRLNNKLTQKELAVRAGISLRTVISYESGTSYPKKRSTYGDLASVLHTDVNYLHNENEEFISEAAEKYGVSGMKQARQLVTQLGGLFAGGELSPQDKQAVFEALQEAYWDAKISNKKYASHKPKGS